MNWKEYFSKEAIQKRLREAGTELATVAVDVAFDQFLESLGLNLVCIQKSLIVLKSHLVQR